MKRAFLNSRAIQNLQYTLLSNINWQIPEILPPYLVEKTHLMPLAEALKLRLLDEMDKEDIRLAKEAADRGGLRTRLVL